MVDSVYEPTRALCDKVLAGYGIETSYYDPQIGAAIAGLIKPNTRVIFLESPGSLSFEMQDIPAITSVAQQHNIVTVLDNTWASPILCQPFTLGVDVSIQAATKYIVGHSDVMLGTATANEKHWPARQLAGLIDPNAPGFKPFFKRVSFYPDMLGDNTIANAIAMPPSLI